MDLEAQAMAAYDATDANNTGTSENLEPDTPDTVATDENLEAEIDKAPDTNDETADDGKDTSNDGVDTTKNEDSTDEKTSVDDKNDDTDDTIDTPDTEEQRPIFDPESTLETFVYEGLEGITVVGKDGLGYTVKVPEELPDDFEFRSTKEEKLFDQAMFRQQSAAEQLVDSYNQQQQVAEQQSYNKSMRSEIDDAIAAGRIDKFDGRKLNMDGKGEKRAQQVLDYMTELNSNYVKAGKNYRVNSFEQALDLLEAKEARDKLAEYQKSIDNGKKSTASMTPSAGQSGGGEGSKPKTMPRNMSASDFVNMLDSQGEI